MRPHRRAIPLPQTPEIIPHGLWQHPVFGQAFVLSVAAKADGEGGGKHWVTGFEADHFCADGFNFPGQFHAPNGMLGMVPPQDKTRHELLAAGDGQIETTHDGVANGDGGGMDFDQHFPVSGRGFLYLFELKNIGRAVFFIYNRFHFSLRPEMFEMGFTANCNLCWLWSLYTHNQKPQVKQQFSNKRKQAQNCQIEVGKGVNECFLGLAWFFLLISQIFVGH